MKRARRARDAARRGLAEGGLELARVECFGKRCVIVDEGAGLALAPTDRPAFARRLTDPDFGLGADTLVVIADSRPAGAEAGPVVPNLRVFDPRGTEAPCCANSLLCAAHYLQRVYGVVACTAGTGPGPGGPPGLQAGVLSGDDRAWVNLGLPGPVQPVSGLRVEFAEQALAPYTAARAVCLDGYRVFAGEPQLVVFVRDGGISVPELADPLFAATAGAGPLFRQRALFGRWLVDQLGRAVNRDHRREFPDGVNLVLVDAVRDGQALAYRCFERGGRRETLGCGSAAVAAASVAQAVFGRSPTAAPLLPRYWRQDPPATPIELGVREAGWHLFGRPRIILRGRWLDAS